MMEQSMKVTQNEMMHFVKTVRESTFDPANVDIQSVHTSKKIQQRTQEFVGQ